MSRRKPLTNRPAVKRFGIGLAGGAFLLNLSGCASMGLPGHVPARPSHAADQAQRPMINTGDVQPVAQTANASQMNAAQVGGGYAPLQPSPTIAQVGYTAAAGASACGCSGCANSACPPRVPFGYEAQSQVWNQYGIDPQEFLCDGGDKAPRTIVRHDDSLVGLGAEDTIVHYTTEAGDIHVEPSNRTCLYAPRFASVRKVTGAVAGERAIGAAGIEKPVATGGFAWDQPGLVVADSKELGRADVTRRLDAMRDRNRGVRIDNVLQIEQATDVLAALAGLTVLELDQLRDKELAVLQQASLAAITWAIDESVEVAIKDVAPPTLTRDQSVEGFTVYDFPDAGRLRIGKLADKHDALPGEVVTFMLRIDNVGDSPVTDIVVTDSLTTRLKYIEGSQTASGGAVFSVEANDVESDRLTWTLTDKLRVGESVTIRFQCRVR